MDMISSASSAASPHHHNHQHQQEPMGTAVASPQTEEVKNAKEAQQLLLQAAAGSGERKPRPAQDHTLKCPRCESTNTKFCYYNNYSMTQPRYFCKACRRYWTQGGSLRNVPVGGGCRKNKRSSTTAIGGASPGSSSSSSKIISTQLVPGPPMVPASTTDFPNVLPTFMSTGFELPRNHRHYLSKPLSSPPPVMAPGAGSFLDILRGGFLDGSSNHQNNSFYGNGMVMPMPPSFGFGVMQQQQQQHGVGDEQAAAIGGGATAATTQAQAQGQVGDGGAHLGSSNDVGMESGSSTSRDCYWNNSASNGGGVPDTRAAPAPANSFFINGSSLI